MSLQLQPVTFEEAAEFVRLHHRHHLPPVGWKFGVGCNDGQNVVGVVTVGRPVARMLDDGYTLEVTRCCVVEGAKNAGSMLYGAAWRATKALGYRRLLTYTLASEPGTTLRAAGWRELYTTKDRPEGWNMPGRPRVIKAPTGAKTLWEAVA